MRLDHFFPSLLITGHQIQFMPYLFETIANGIFIGHIMPIIEHCMYIWVFRHVYLGMPFSSNNGT